LGLYLQAFHSLTL